ncbi:hypothetical protein [Paenibacillus paridis]|uniref:hypothetical protein n=1 Tax=Paenibacillus paridis TaxID=2583376 RepID=UPI00111FEB60|nr:hypothetical protein [Paenibacillus paridis]
MSSKGMKILIVITCCILLVLLMNPISLSAYYNNYRLNKFEKKLFNLSLPPNTRELSKYSKVGGLYGNGDNCDFLARRKIVSSLDIEELIKFYNTDNKGVQIIINYIEQSSEGNIVELEVVEEGKNSYFDLRCT